MYLDGMDNVLSSAPTGRGGVIIPLPVTPTHAATPRRVAMLVPGGLEHAGGIGRWAGYLQATWSEQGLQPPLEIVDTRGSGHAGNAALAFARALFRLMGLRLSGRLGTVHANLSKRGSTARKLIVSLLAAATGTPLVLHLHGSGYDGFFAALPAFAQRRVAAMFRRADRVVVLGQGWADWVVDTLGVPPQRVHILYNGVPLPARVERREGPCRILFLGRIGARKGVPELLQALGSAPLRNRGWTAVLAGDGEVEPYRSRVAEAGLAERIALPGWLDAAAAADLLAQADILVLPSHAENFPIAVIEALAAQVAVITTPVGATPELLSDGQSALFVPAGDALALADAIARLIDDPALRHAIAAAGRIVFMEKLDIATLARRLAALHAPLCRHPAC